MLTGSQKHSIDLENTGNPPPSRSTPLRCRTRLRTVGDCRQELGKLYREARSGKVEVSDASRLANILMMLGRMIETSDLEGRLEALEKASAS